MIKFLTSSAKSPINLLMTINYLAIDSFELSYRQRYNGLITTIAADDLLTDTPPHIIKTGRPYEPTTTRTGKTLKQWLLWRRCLLPLCLGCLLWKTRKVAGSKAGVRNPGGRDRRRSSAKASLTLQQRNGAKTVHFLIIRRYPDGSLCKGCRQWASFTWLFYRRQWSAITGQSTSATPR